MSVISSWMGEFRKWCPSLRIIRLHTNDVEERVRLADRVVNDVDDWDVCVTTYEIAKGQLHHALSRQVVWRTVTLDEGHKVKNVDSQTSQAIKDFRACCKLLLTGTCVFPSPTQPGNE